MFLSKQVRTIVAGRQSDAQTDRSLYTSSTTNNTPWGKEATCMAMLSLEIYASITVVDLIQQKKLDFWNFYESNLTEARFEIILFSTIVFE